MGICGAATSAPARPTPGVGQIAGREGRPIELAHRARRHVVDGAANPPALR